MRFRYGALLRALTVLPMITPAFVIGLAIILLFGLSGMFHPRLRGADFGTFSRRAGSTACRACSSRKRSLSRPSPSWCMIGVVEGVSPSMEEAAQTLASQSMADILDGLTSADAARPRQCIPARIH
jgi:iron(III) transport system permease protein